MKATKLWWRLLLRYQRESILLCLLCAVQVIAFCQSWFLVDKIALRNQQASRPPPGVRSSTASSSVERLDKTTAAPTRRLAVESSQYISNDLVQEWLLFNAEPPDTPGAFLHLGKTGGSTLSSLLRNGCHSHIPKPCHKIPEAEESYLSRLSTYYHMPDFDKLRSNQTSYAFYTLTLRDPLDRTISSLVYTHPANQERLGNNIRYRHEQFFTPCFPDLNEFASSLHQYNTSAPRRNGKCSRSAYRALHNQAKWVEHLYYDVRYVTSQAIVPNRTILVIRMEHLANDWIAANEYLGQTNVVRPALHLRQHNDTRLPIDKNSLSDVSRQYLCDALAEEYSVYLQLIWRARNLHTNDRHEAYERARHQCPHLNLPMEGELNPQ